MDAFRSRTDIRELSRSASVCACKCQPRKGMISQRVLVFPDGLRMFVGLSGQQQVDVAVVESGPLGRRSVAVFVQEVEEDRQLHGVAGELVEVMTTLRKLPQLCSSKFPTRRQ